MGKFILSAGIGLFSGLMCLLLSFAFLCIFLVIFGALSHTHPDMTLTYKVAVPVAVLAAFLGFVISLVHSFRSAASQ